MPTEQPEGNIRDLKDFKDIQRACCKKDPPQPGGPQGAGGYIYIYIHIYIYAPGSRKF